MVLHTSLSEAPHAWLLADFDRQDHCMGAMSFFCHTTGQALHSVADAVSKRTDDVNTYFNPLCLYVHMAETKDHEWLHAGCCCSIQTCVTSSANQPNRQHPGCGGPPINNSTTGKQHWQLADQHKLQGHLIGDATLNRQCQGFHLRHDSHNHLQLRLHHPRPAQDGGCLRRPAGQAGLYC